MIRSLYLHKARLLTSRLLYRSKYKAQITFVSMQDLTKPIMIPFCKITRPDITYNDSVLQNNKTDTESGEDRYRD